MKLFFLLAVLANLALFAWMRGAFGTLPDSGREPERIAQQIEADRVRVLTDKEVQALREKSKEQPNANRPAPGTPAAAGASTVANAGDAGGTDATAGCLVFGDFGSEALAARARGRLAQLNLGDRLSVRTVELPGWYMVFIPPFRTREAVDQRADELRELGVKEMLVVADNSPMRFGIALGAFKDRDLAVKHQADLNRRGVKDARVPETASTVAVTRFLIKNADTALEKRLAPIQKEFPQQKLQACS